MHRHLQTNATHQEMRDQREHQADDQQQLHGRDHQSQTGKHEHIEAVVDAELRVGNAELLVIEHQQDLGPVGIELRAEEHAHHQRHHNRDAHGELRTDALAHFDHIAIDANGGAVRRVWAGADGQPGGNEGDQRHQHRIRHPQADFDAKLGPDHRREAKLAIPHQVGDEMGQTEEQGGDHDQRHHDSPQDARPVARAGGLRAAGDARPIIGTARRNGRACAARMILVAIGLNVDDDRVVIVAAIGSGLSVAGIARVVGVTGVEIRIEDAAEHIKERHESSLSDSAENLAFGETAPMDGIRCGQWPCCRDWRR